MARVKRAVNAQKKRRTLLETASGYRGQRSRLYRKAKEQVLHSMQYAYRDRRDRKGDFRQLWITRINAAARANGMTYNRLIQGLQAGRRRGGPQDPGRHGRQRRRRRSRRSSRSRAPPSRPRAPAALPRRLPDLASHVSRRLPSTGRRLSRCRRGGRRDLHPPYPPGRRGPAPAAPPRPRPDRPLPGRRAAGRARGAGRRGGARALRHATTRAGPATPTWPLQAPQVSPVTDDALAALAETVQPQGLVAVCEQVDVPLADALAKQPRLVAVVAEIRDPGNAGTVLRTADAAGAGAVVFAGDAVDPYNGKCVRASAGSAVPRRRGPRPPLDAWSPTCATAGLQVLATTGYGDDDLDDLLDDGDAGRADRVAVRLGGARPARRPAGRGRPAGPGADLRRRGEPQPGRGRRGLPVRFGPSAALPYRAAIGALPELEFTERAGGRGRRCRARALRLARVPLVGGRRRTDASAVLAQTDPPASRAAVCQPRARAGGALGASVRLPDGSSGVREFARPCPTATIRTIRSRPPCSPRGARGRRRRGARRRSPPRPTSTRSAR